MHAWVGKKYLRSYPVKQHETDFKILKESSTKNQVIDCIDRLGKYLWTYFLSLELERAA